MASLADAARVSRIKWGCRRGLLENDLIIQKFFQQHEASLTNDQADALMLLPLAAVVIFFAVAPVLVRVMLTPSYEPRTDAVALRRTESVPLALPPVWVKVAVAP